MNQIDDNLEFVAKLVIYIKENGWDDFCSLDLHHEAGAQSFYNELIKK